MNQEDPAKAYLELINRDMIAAYGGNVEKGDVVYLSQEYIDWYRRSGGTFNKRVGDRYEVVTVNADRGSALLRSGSSILPSVPLGMIYRMSSTPPRKRMS